MEQAAIGGTGLTIVIPYRNRAVQLRKFIAHMQAFLKGSHFRLLVVEQADEMPFNRGELLNIGVAMIDPGPGWVALHDVDMLPMNAECDYSRPQSVRHIAGAAEQYEYGLPYRNYVGGVLLTTKEAFEVVNGFSNQYWGWGGEDDDFYIRMWLTGTSIERRNGRFRSLPHQLSSPGILNQTQLASFLAAAATPVHDAVRLDVPTFRRSPERYFSPRREALDKLSADGFTTTRYRLLGRTDLHQYTLEPKDGVTVGEIVQVSLA